MSGRLKMKRAKLAVHYARLLISIRPASGGVVEWERVVTTFPQLFTLVTLLENSQIFHFNFYV